MKLIIANEATMSAELIIVAQENLQKLVDETKCPNSKALLDRKVFKAKFGEVLPLLHGERIVVLLGLGAKQDFLQSEYDKAMANAAAQLKKLDIKEVAVSIDYAFVSGDAASFARETVRALISEAYVFDELKTTKEDYSLDSLELVYTGEQDIDKAAIIGSAIACGQNYTKDLQNLPANICTTDYMLNEARELTNKHDKFDLDYLNEEQMAELGMGCALAVGRGSDMSNYTVCMEYNGADNDDAPIVLVGKGFGF